jgi:hypothetical protein
MKGFNLANFKKIKETADWATLIHKDGHTINIAKAPLLPIQRKQLENLAIHEVNQYAQGGDAESGDSNGANSEQQPSELQGIMNDVAANAPPASSPASTESETDDTQDTAPPVQQPQQAPAPQSIGQAQNTGLGQEQAGNTALAEAQGEEGTKAAKAYQDTATAIGALPTQQAIIKKNSDNDAALAKSFQSGAIDPDHYFQNHSKVAAGIGILLSGLGQAIGAGKVQGSGALDVIQNGINRDIEAQKQNSGQKLTLWQMNRQALGNDLAANATTQNQLYTALQHKISATAAASQKPVALAQAQINNAKIQQIKDANNFKLSLLQPTSDNPDPASRVQFLVPPTEQAKVADSMNAAKNTVANAPGILEAFDNASKEVRPLSGGTGTSPTAFVPGLKSAGQQALQARLGPTFQDVEGTVRQAAMDNLDKNVTPAFGDSDSTIATKRQSLINYMRSKSAASLPKAYGIDLSKFPSTNTAAIGQQVQPQTKIVNGVKYMRGANGQAVPIK